MPSGWARPSGDLSAAEEFLAATTTLTVATGIVNMWQYEAHQVAASFQRVEQRFPGRFLLGVGAGHPEVTQQYARPYDTLTRYVDTLLDDGVPAAGWSWPPSARRCCGWPPSAPPAPIPTW